MAHKLFYDDNTFLSQPREKRVLSERTVLGALALGALTMIVSCSTPKEVSAPPRSLVPSNQSTPILVMGTFHFAGSSDVQFEKPQGVFSERRQRELEELSSRISAFRPTKVLIEWSPEVRERVNAEYRAYLSGEFDLGENEVYQIAFRVAKMSGLDQIHPVDHMIDLPNSRALAKAIGQGDLVEQFNREEADRGQDSVNRNTGSWIDYFIHMNSPLNIQASHSFYVDLLPLLGYEGSQEVRWEGAPPPDPEYLGTDVLTLWYKRNLRIYTNITRLNQAGDRIFLLIGAGHTGVLRELFSSSSRFDLVEPLDYL